MDDIRSLMSCLNSYCSWSGQSISIEKSGIFFSKGVHGNFKNQLKSIWGFKTLPENTKYLGIPLFLSNNKRRDFKYLKENLEAKTSSWKCKSLSWMGKATLIKSVALAIPSYTMAVCKLPKGLCEEMDAIVRRFWWGPRKETLHYFTPMAWSKLCTPKKEGGLGFKSLWDLNLASLAKLAWQVLSKKESPCINLLLSKYRVNGNWFKHQPSPMASWIWKSLESTKSILSKGACLMIGDGNNILVWDDPWIPGCEGFLLTPKERTTSTSSLVVSQLITPDKSGWDMNLLKKIL